MFIPKQYISHLARIYLTPTQTWCQAQCLFLYQRKKKKAQYSIRGVLLFFHMNKTCMCERKSQSLSNHTYEFAFNISEAFITPLSKVLCPTQKS